MYILLKFRYKKKLCIETAKFSFYYAIMIQSHYTDKFIEKQANYIITSINSVYDFL